MSDLKKITEYEIIDHGVENSQYFQGYGITFTRFEDAATGVGDTPAEALEDALDQLAQDDWNTESITDKLSDESRIPTCDEHNEGNCDCSPDLWHHVTVRVRGEK